MKPIFSEHARLVCHERDIDPALAEKVIETPEWIEPDPARPGRVLAFGRIQQRGAEFCAWYMWIEGTIELW